MTTIRINDGARLRVEQDTDASCPRGDWDMATGFVKIDGHGDSRYSDVPAVHNDPIGISGAHERLDEHSHRMMPASSTRSGRVFIKRFETSEVTARWARIFHGIELVWDAEHGGFWFVNPEQLRDGWGAERIRLAGGSSALQLEIIKGERETYEQWARGDVFGVVLERTETWTKVVRNHAGVERTEEGVSWVVEESIWGSYLDADYTAEQVALEHFDFTEDERLVLEEAMAHRSETA